MKDAPRHLKHLQRKTIREMKKESPSEALASSGQSVVIEFRRPKVLQNRRKSSIS